MKIPISKNAYDSLCKNERIRVLNSKKQSKSSIKCITVKLHPQKVIRNKFCIAVLALAGSFITFTQALSKGLIFSDPNAGNSKTFYPMQSDLVHTDPNGHTYKFPHLFRKDHQKIIVAVFGVHVSWQNAKIGSQILANLMDNPVVLVHNGSVNKIIDYIRAGLNRTHCWLLGIGHEKSINSLEKRLYSILLDESTQEKTVEIIGHSAGASTVYSALKGLIRKHPELIDRIKRKATVQFWGSPEYFPNMLNLSKYCQIKIFNRTHDYIVEGFQKALYGGLGLPFAMYRIISTISNFGNQHSAILYLADYLKEIQGRSFHGSIVKCSLSTSPEET
ncbi:MAG: alpha/beta hydrolase [Candidatus Caenarcaniphilales bacterium]|nr:alpha/beta hydrolase [Candidatus Caenarcaniphilales bacterium]